jgi:hypothetical protein
MATLFCYHDNVIMLSCYHETIFMLSCYHGIMIVLSCYYDNAITVFDNLKVKTEHTATNSL